MTEIQFIGPVAYIPEESLLIAGDLHIGSDYALASGGAISPLIGLTEIRETFAAILKEVSPKIIVLLGDIQVDFGPTSLKEKREILSFIEHLSSKTEKLVLIKGNHDNHIEKVLAIKGFSFVDNFQLGDIFCTHGDKIPEFQKEVKFIFIGHEHPAISISNGIRTERFKCIVKLPYKKKTLYVLPAISQMYIGTDISKEKLQSPFLQDISKAEITVVEGMKTFNFGALKKLC